MTEGDGSAHGAYVEALAAREVTEEQWKVMSATEPVRFSKQISPEMRRVIGLHVAGFRNHEIAEALGIHETSVSFTVRHPALQEYKRQLTDVLVRGTIHDARSAVKAYAHEATMKLVDLMRNAKDSVALNATNSLLDRGGVPRETVSQETKLLLDKSGLEDIRQALEDLKEVVPEMQEVAETHQLLKGRVA